MFRTDLSGYKRAIKINSTCCSFLMTSLKFDIICYDMNYIVNVIYTIKKISKFYVIN